MTMKEKKPGGYFLYARKSTESEDRQALSIESQIESMRKIAKRENLKIADVLTESQSAKKLHRPVFGEMLDRIQKGEADGILCWKLDRLARNMMDGGKIIEMLHAGTIRHIQSFERDYSPSDNVLLMAVEFGMANQYSRDLAVNVTRGLNKKAELGWYPVQPPLGYLNSRTSAKGANTILKDEQRWDIVRKLWDMMLTGSYTPPMILDIATKKLGLRTRPQKRNPSGIMARSNIYHLFTNHFYYGRFEWPRGSGNWYTGNHDPMITIDEYDKVQMLLGRKGRPRPQTKTFDFAGTMRCGECGCVITAEEKKKVQKNGNAHRYVYYHCTKHGKKPCAQGSIEEKELNAQIDAELATLEIPESFHQWGLKWIKQEVEREKAVRGVSAESQRRAYDTAVSKVERLIDMRVNGEITEEELRAKKGEAMKEKERLSELLNDADGSFTRWADNMENALSFVATAREKFKNGAPEQRRRIFMALGSNLLLKDRKVIFDEANSLLPMKKLSASVRKIHDSLEPVKKARKQGHFDSLYESSPIVSAL
jgi:site-specific DNA recombinase